MLEAAVEDAVSLLLCVSSQTQMVFDSFHNNTILATHPNKGEEFFFMRGSLIFLMSGLFLCSHCVSFNETCNDNVVTDTEKAILGMIMKGKDHLTKRKTNI